MYGLGYPSLPVLSVDEFYDQRVKEGWFPPTGQGKSLQVDFFNHLRNHPADIYKLKLHVRWKSFMFLFNYIYLIAFEKNKLIWISFMETDKFAFLILVYKIKLEELWDYIKFNRKMEEIFALQIWSKFASKKC